MGGGEAFSMVLLSLLVFLLLLLFLLFFRWGILSLGFRLLDLSGGLNLGLLLFGLVLVRSLYSRVFRLENRGEKSIKRM